MALLKNLPIKYVGELHDIRLVNFKVEKKEVQPLVPNQIKIRDFDGKAMISMVDVKLKKMHPHFLPAFLHFEYRHVAFRLLVDDSKFNDGECKGIYFLKSFTNKPHIVLGGKMLTNYNLEKAEIEEKIDSVEIRKGGKHILYQRNDKPHLPTENLANLQKQIGAIDRAYAVQDGDLTVTQIMREKWPIEPVECAFFKNTFFEKAELEGVFRVNEVIYYNWLPARKV
jgi:uncharacterized protein YqjF (DUF2071 family)